MKQHLIFYTSDKNYILLEEIKKSDYLSNIKQLKRLPM